LKQTYKIKKPFMVPFAAAVLLLLVLMIMTLVSGALWEKILIAILFALSFIVAVESAERKFTFSEEGLSLRKFFRTKQFSWSEITHLGIVVLRNKAYFLLTTTKGFYILSNMLEKHTELVRSIAGKLDGEKVEPDINQYLEHPIERMSTVVLMWVAVVVLVAIIIHKSIAS